MIDNEVSTIVVVTNTRRGRPARRDITSASTVPMTLATHVSWANPTSGIASPPTVSGTSIARARVATPTVSADATRPAAAPVAHRDVTVRSRRTVGAVSVAVAVIGVLP